MIFVTVGTHEQGMDRLFIELDRLIESKQITEEVFVQIGYSKYKPKYYKYKKMIGYDEMDKYVKKADIVITHGGPGSIFHPLQYGKIPIVVPRNPEFNEHVDEHQILFTKRLENSSKVIALYDICELIYLINNYKEFSMKCKIDSSSKKSFIEKFNDTLKKELNI
ncbi:glycosyltransferase [Clostridium botulinum]|uniref:glycosyltransferase n=1 Tax=Clostridium botulinum TaxID=1491 RepID=UPI000774B126|nr:glycosyltransferase [Clostridium botulinum]MBY6931426.1 glycosyl transferase family 28 [Clostridium botulinum]NFG22229.1 glycosyl transferase family 28 [Clostridium botulinum]NFO58352.1 glycosyl transferase family 28 [Clostridium botulinum]NFO80531.1 glycosyl transferase family 28 [Clostridium botulinum]HBJ1647381.1 glycosyl transferase family 28 [Clostridium botulinum]